MKKTRLQMLEERIVLRLEGEQRQQLPARMEEEYRLLCEQYDSRFEAMTRHTHNNIFPVAAAMRALLAGGMEREKAAGLAGDCFLELMEDAAEMIRKLLKVPGLYRLMPWLWKTLMPKMFSEDSGFRYSFYPTDSREVRFDMTVCPYYQICKELDCLDLAPVFCATDDVCYGHMHPRLIWHRTETIARGGALCNFDLTVK